MLCLGRELSASQTKGENMELKAPVYYTYKDRVFRLLFKEKKRLLELYNALNDTHYTNEEDLIINTLDNAIYIKMKNDISFIIDCNMCLYEHQSTYSPNLPLRGFFYFADLYKKLTKDIDISVRKLIKIPTPHYIVFYNGLEKQSEEFAMKLSDAFEDASEGCMELTVRVLNINLGHNETLFEKCSSLYGYSYFVATIRKYLNIMELSDAVEVAIDECIQAGILKEFLLEHKAEVVAMSIYEYNEEYVRKSLYEDGVEDGYAKGEAQQIVKSVENVMENLKVNLQKSCEIIGVTVEEYEKAKQNKSDVSKESL